MVSAQKHCCTQRYTVTIKTNLRTARLLYLPFSTTTRSPGLAAFWTTQEPRLIHPSLCHRLPPWSFSCGGTFPALWAPNPLFRHCATDVAIRLLETFPWEEGVNFGIFCSGRKGQNKHGAYLCVICVLST